MSQTGISLYLANKILDHVFRNVPYTPPATIYLKLHLGQPGGAGTSFPSVVTTRLAVPFAAAAGGAVTVTTTYPVYSMTATELLTHGSYWDAPTGGNFLASGQLSTPTPESNGNTYTFNMGGVSFAAFLAS